VILLLRDVGALPRLAPARLLDQGGGCTAVITSPESMVFGVIPVAILGLAFYVAAVPLSPRGRGG